MRKTLPRELMLWKFYTCEEEWSCDQMPHMTKLELFILFFGLEIYVLLHKKWKIYKDLSYQQFIAYNHETSIFVFTLIFHWFFMLYSIKFRKAYDIEKEKRRVRKKFIKGALKVIVNFPRNLNLDSVVQGSNT